jgi:hypothetical protein
MSSFKTRALFGMREAIMQTEKHRGEEQGKWDEYIDKTIAMWRERIAVMEVASEHQSQVLMREFCIEDIAQGRLMGGSDG